EPSAWSATLSKCESGAPEMYQGEPLSATITPYFFMAAATIFACDGRCAMSTLALSRSRNPIGGSEVSCDDDAWWRAGHRELACVAGTVTRIACLMCPDLTSDQVTRPGRIGSPAASAEVQPAGRSALLPR